nr:hypothetical protein [Tanacetum cinerariifolium]
MLKASGLTRLRKVGTAQRVESSANTEVDAEKDYEVQGRLPESQAQVYHLDLEDAQKVLSMQETDETEPAEVEEVLEVVTAAKLMTEVVTTATTPITIAPVPKASALRKRRGVIIQDHEEAATASLSVQSKDAAEGFEQIIDFLNGSYIHYALTVNPHIYVSCIKQFWNTALVNHSDDVTRLQALVDRKKIVISEDVIHEILQLDDAEGVVCLPNEEIFTGLAQMGYEKPSTKLTFYKAFFSSQWKFLIHTLQQSLSAKRTSWNEFNTTMASAVICLST